MRLIQKAVGPLLFNVFAGEEITQKARLSTHFDASIVLLLGTINPIIRGVALLQ